MNENPVSPGIRLLSIFLDYLAAMILMGLLMLPQMVSSLAEALKVTHEHSAFDFQQFNWIFLVVFTFFFFKDCIKGRSLAKRILKLQVVNNLTGLPASPLQSFLRNIPILIWPIELAVTMFSPSRRIGDRIANTSVVRFASVTERTGIDFAQLTFSLVLSFGLSYVLTSSYDPDKISIGDQPTFVATSYNEEESHKLASIYKDSLGTYFTSDIRIYDKMEKDDRRYVSIIARAKYNFLTNDNELSIVDKKIMELLYANYPGVTGRLQYFYQVPGHSQKVSKDF